MMVLYVTRENTYIYIMFDKWLTSTVRDPYNFAIFTNNTCLFILHIWIFSLEYRSFLISGSRWKPRVYLKSMRCWDLPMSLSASPDEQEALIKALISTGLTCSWRRCNMWGLDWINAGLITVEEVTCFTQRRLYWYGMHEIANGTYAK